MENDSRVRLLRILQLLQDTDEQHPISTAQIDTALRERFGIETYRITIQKDVAALEAAGYDVVTIRTTQNKYYLASRAFELPELKLLIDAVESSKFITERKSRVLVEKLTALAGSHQAGELKRNISISDRIKPKNEQIYYIMDAINEAINQKRKISFLYFAFDGDKRRKLKNDGEQYVFSPYTLTWNGDYYYVVGFSDKHGKVATFRVDRIYSVPKLLEEPVVPRPKDYTIADFSEKAFRLFDKEHERVTLLCDDGMMNTVLDHFGEKIKTERADETHFRTTVEVALSPTFYSWVFEFGGGIRIEAPQSVKEAYHERLRAAMEETP